MTNDIIFKHLEWHTTKHGASKSYTILGHYIIVEDYYTGKYFFTLYTYDDEFRSEYFDNLDDAKLGAWNDFKRRILSTLILKD